MLDEVVLLLEQPVLIHPEQPGGEEQRSEYEPQPAAEPLVEEVLRAGVLQLHTGEVEARLRSLVLAGLLEHRLHDVPFLAFLAGGLGFLGLIHKVAGHGFGLRLGIRLVHALGLERLRLDLLEELAFLGLPASFEPSLEPTDYRFAPGAGFLRHFARIPLAVGPSGELRLIAEDRFVERLPVRAAELADEPPQRVFFESGKSQSTEEGAGPFEGVFLRLGFGTIREEPEQEAEPDGEDGEAEPRPQQVEQEERGEEEDAAAGPHEPVEEAHAEDDGANAGEDGAAAQSAVNREVSERRQEHEADEPAGNGRQTRDRAADYAQQAEAEENQREEVLQLALRVEVELMGELLEFVGFLLGRIERPAGAVDAEEAFQRGNDLVHALMAVVRLLRHHLHQDRGKRLGDALDHDLGRYDRLRLMLADDLERGLAFEGRLAGDQHVERAAEGIDVGPLIDGGGVAGLFGRHVRRGAHGRTDPREFGLAILVVVGRGKCSGLLREVAAGQFHEPQVRDLHDPFGVEHQVVRLDVAMNHALVVAVAEAAGRLQNVPHRGFRRELAFLLHQLHERLAGHEFHAEEVLPAVFSNVVNLDDVVVRELSGGVGFAREPGHEAGVLGDAGMHHFEGDFAIERDLPPEQDGPHAALAEHFEDFVAAEFLGDVVAERFGARFGLELLLGGFRLGLILGAEAIGGIAGLGFIG